jgi:hypothetical protein
MVYQEYDSTSTSTSVARLPACIVGPCYHIIDPVEDETLALYGRYTSEGIDSGFFPNNAAGALIDKDSVKFRFKNAMVTLQDTVYADGTGPGTFWATTPTMEVEDGFWDDDEGGDEPVVTELPTTTGTPITVAPGVNGNAYTVSDASMIANVTTGDYVTFRSGEERRVIGIDFEAGTLLLNRNCPNNMPIKIQRKVEEFYVLGTDTGVFLDVSSERFTLHGITCTIDGVSYPVTESELYVGYKALRQDLSTIKTVESVDQIEGLLGKITPENPLAFGVSIAIANSSTSTMCIGVTSDNLAGYTDAKDRLEQEDPVYGIVPLTFDTGVLTMFKNHCEEYSTPTMSRWRMAFGCTRLAKERKMFNSTGVVSRDGDGDLVVLHTDDPEVTFLSSGVNAGDILTLTAADGSLHNYTVSFVASEDTLTVTQSNPFDHLLFIPGSTAYRFVVTHKMDRLEQAQWLRDSSKAYAYQRFVNIYPDVCVVNGEEVPGYYLGCAVAGGVAALPSHYGMTRLSVSGISAVKNSSDYFNNEQLDVIADGGTFIFVQANPTSAPYIRHQLTTDTTVIEYRELSFVKNFDYVSYVCRDAIDDFIGRYNITPTTLNSLKTALNATLESLKLEAFDRIGSRLLDYSVISVQQLSDIRDRVEMYAEISMPYPLNTIGLHLKSVFLQVSSS